MEEILKIILNSPLVWITTISLIVRSFWRNDKGMLTEKEYYHSLHTAIEKIVRREE